MKNQRPGFTVLEMIITIIILVVVIGFSLVNLKTGIRSENLRTAKSSLMDDLKDLQTYAIAGKEVGRCSNQDKVCEEASDCDGGSCEKKTPIGGYIFTISYCFGDICSYKLCANFDEIGSSNDCDEGEVFGEKSLGNGIQVSNIKLDNLYTTKTVNVVFHPYSTEMTMPNYTVTGTGNKNEAGSTKVATRQIRITLREKAANKIITLTIDKYSGEIY